MSALVVIAICTGAFVWRFFRGDALDAVSIGDAAAQVQDAGPSTIDTAVTRDLAVDGIATADQPAAEDPATNGRRNLDGGFVCRGVQLRGLDGDVRRIQGRRGAVGDRVDHGGRSHSEITGTLVVEGTTVTAVTIEADTTAITTNESRLHDKVQDALDTRQFPTATFELTQPDRARRHRRLRRRVSVEADGELTIHGVTTPVTIPLEAQLVGDHVVAVGSPTSCSPTTG